MLRSGRQEGWEAGRGLGINTAEKDRTEAEFQQAGGQRGQEGREGRQEGRQGW